VFFDLFHCLRPCLLICKSWHLLVIANKKKKVGSHKSRLKQQKMQADSQLINDSTVFALAASSPPCTVHATVPSNSNSNSSPPVTFAPVCPHPNPRLHSPPHDPGSQYHVDPSPSINHVFVEDCSDVDEEVDFDSSEEDYEGGSKFFTTPVFAVPPGPSAPPVVTPPTPVLSPSCADSVLAAVPALSALKAPMDAHVPLTATASPGPEPSSSTWRHLFMSNRDTTRCPKLLHYSDFTETRGCNLVDDDLDTKCDYWKLCLGGYIAGRSPSFKAIQHLITTTWHCEASLTIHASSWLIFKFATEADKLNVLSEGPYLIYGRPLILRAMPEYFDFSSSDMHTIPVWVKFPNLPLKCWSIKCLFKIASVLGKPVQSDMLTSTISRLSYARVLVEVNLLSDLPYSLKFLCLMVAYFINKLCMKPFIVFASIAKSLVILLPLAQNPYLLLFPGSSRLLPQLQLQKEGILFFTGWGPK